MHQRHQRGAVWLPDPATRRAASRTHINPDRPGPPQIIWASIVWRGCRGRYVAIRLVGQHGGQGALEVGIARQGAVEWLPAEKCLTEGEALRWARMGF